MQKCSLVDFNYKEVAVETFMTSIKLQFLKIDEHEHHFCRESFDAHLLGAWKYVLSLLWNFEH